MSFGRTGGQLTVTSMTGTDTLSGVEFVTAVNPTQLNSAGQPTPVQTYVVVEAFGSTAAAINAAPEGSVLVQAGAYSLSQSQVETALGKGLTFYGNDTVTVNVTAESLSTVDAAKVAAWDAAGVDGINAVSMFTISDSDAAMISNGLTLGGNINVVSVAGDDAGTAVEGGVNASVNAIGNVLANDTDTRDVVSDTLAVVGVRTGAEGTAAVVGTGNVGAALQGTFGSITINADGSYTYVVDNANAQVDALSVGQSITDTFTYAVSDGNGGVDQAQLVVNITGSNDVAVITGTKTFELTESNDVLTATRSEERRVGKSV
jgi:VCBS repeat-containing protein